RAARARRPSSESVRGVHRESPTPRRAPRGAARASRRARAAGRPGRRWRNTSLVTDALTDDARSWRDSPRVALSVLTGLNCLNSLDRYVAAATLPLILHDLGISDADAGLLQSAFIVTYSLVSPGVGWLGDRLRRTRIAATGVFVWSVATVC